jgi:hypothetical protein
MFAISPKHLFILKTKGGGNPEGMLHTRTPAGVVGGG